MIRTLTQTIPNWLSKRDPSSFNFGIEVNCNFGSLRKVIDWCESNIESEWGWLCTKESEQYIPTGNAQYSFYFDSNKDATAFSLRWKS